MVGDWHSGVHHHSHAVELAVDDVHHPTLAQRLTGYHTDSIPIGFSAVCRHGTGDLLRVNGLTGCGSSAGNYRFRA